MIKLIDIGKSEKGKVIHAITVLGKSNKDNHAACDKRQTGMILDSKLDVLAITCSKCLQRADVKEALANQMQKKSGKTAEQQKTTSGIPVAKSKKKKRGGVKSKPDISPPKKKEETTPQRTGDIVDGEGGDFFARLKPGGNYKLYHSPTGKVFFDSIPEEVALDAVINLNEIKERWKSLNQPLPKNFISTCRQILRDAFYQAGQTIPNSLVDKDNKSKKKDKKKIAPASKTEAFRKGDKMLAVVNGKEVVMEHNGKNFVAMKKKKDKVEEKPKAKRTIKRREKTVKAEKPKRVIKRRGVKDAEKKTEKRIIKRRDPAETLYGRRKGTSAYTVVSLLKSGSDMKTMAYALKRNHKVTEKRALTIIKGIIRKTCRKQGIPIIVMMGTEPINDHYQIDITEE